MKPGLAMMCSGRAPREVDPLWANVVSLLNFKGAHGSPVFNDERGKTWSVKSGSNARIEVSGGESYGVFDGDGDGIWTVDHDDFNFGSGDFCIEALVTPASVSSTVRHIAGQFGSAPNMCVMLYQYAAGAGVTAGTASIGGYDGTFDVSGGTSLAVAAKAHIALVRYGNVFTVYINGIAVITKTDSRTLFNSSKNFWVGSNDHASGQAFYGKMHALRVTKGVARYTSSFTPPPAPFPTS